MKKTPQQHWAAGKPDSRLQFSEKVKAIILARAAQLREERAETPENAGGQDDD